QFAIRSAFLLGAERVIAIDRFPERLQMAGAGNAEMINYEEVDDVIEVLKYLTGGRGPDACIDAVGMEAHGHGMFSVYDSAKLALRQFMTRPNWRSDFLLIGQLHCARRFRLAGR